MVEKDFQAGSDRGLGQLRLTHILLGKLNGPGSVPVKDKGGRTVFVDHAVCQVGIYLPGGPDAARLIQDTGAEHLGNGLQNPGAADARGGRAADGGDDDLSFRESDTVDGAGEGGHAVGEVPSLEGGPGCSGGGEDLFLRRQGYLAVGSQVEEKRVISD